MYKPFSHIVFGILMLTCGFVGKANGLTIAAPKDPILYVVDSRSQLGTINLANFEVDVIGNMGVNMFDIAFRGDGTLFGVDPAGLYEIDPATAATTPVGGANFGRGFGGTTMNALVFSRQGTLYGAGRDSTLYTIDPNTGIASPIGPIGFDSAGDLAFDKHGQLLMSSTRNSLVSIDLATGAGTEIGDLGYSSVLGLVRDHEDEMYGLSYSDVFKVDPITGQGTQFFNYGSSDLSRAYGGSFREEARTPEPTTLGLAGLSMLCLVCRRASRRTPCA